MGRPKTDNPKNYSTRIRLDKKTAEKLEFCAKEKNTTKSDVIREGIDLVEQQILGK